MTEHGGNEDDGQHPFPLSKVDSHFWWIVRTSCASLSERDCLSSLICCCALRFCWRSASSLDTSVACASRCVHNRQGVLKLTDLLLCTAVLLALHIPAGTPHPA
eukprot:scaffold97360_cov17-Tisochrysis_lutea.AAC.1